MSWQESQAEALDDQAAVVAAAENALENAVAVLERRNRGDSCSEFRAAASLLRLEAQTISGEARELRQEPAGDVLPMTFTTRHVR